MLFIKLNLTMRKILTAITTTVIEAAQQQQDAYDIIDSRHKVKSLENSTNENRNSFLLLSLLHHATIRLVVRHTD